MLFVNYRDEAATKQRPELYKEWIVYARIAEAEVRN
jgi:hypothetical protein